MRAFISAVVLLVAVVSALAAFEVLSRGMQSAIALGVLAVYLFFEWMW